MKKMRGNNAVGPQVRKRNSGQDWATPVLAVLVLIGSTWAATQYFAYSFQYSPSLGTNINHVYPPWRIFVWASYWYERMPDAFTRAGGVGMMLAAIGIFILIVRKSILRNTARGNEYLHGSARWAGLKDIRAAGLLPRPPHWWSLRPKKSDAGGVYVGGWEDNKGVFHYLRHNGPEHVLTYAPTRSGKGVGLVVPTMLSWPESAFVTDLKGELWSMTAGWRRKYARNKVVRFEPAALDCGAAWNPLDEIRLQTENEVGDVQNLATLIVDPDGKGLDSHWQKTSYSLLVGVILHVLYKALHGGPAATLPEVDATLSDPERDVRELWTEMATYGHINGEPHPAVGSAGKDMLDRPEEEAGSVLSTAKSYLSLYRDPVVARNVSHSQFRVRDLMHNTHPVTLYMVTQPNDKARLRPLVRILANMVVRLLADGLTFENGRAKAHYKHRMLMMLDEFPSLGKLQILQESLAFVAGYGIKCYLICQDINQLKSRETAYGHDEQITSNCHVQNAYPPNRIETAEHLSKLTGQTTVVNEKVTTSGNRLAASMGHVSRTYQEIQRPLLTPDECMRMPGPQKDASDQITEAGDMVVYVAGHPAIYGKQPLFFRDPVFLARAQVDMPKQSDVLRTAKKPEQVAL